MQPPPEGIWGMPPEMLASCRATIRTSRRTAPKRARSWRSSATGRTSGSRSRSSTRNIPPYRDPAVILIDQLKEIYIDGELEPIDTTQWYPDDDAQGLHGRAQPDRHLCRRPGRAVLRELRLRRRRQLQRLLQPGDRQADRPAIDGVGPGEAQTPGLGDRAAADRGRRQAAGLFQQGGDLLAAERQEPDRDGQQHLQRLADGGHLAE